jgi:EAL domain-containing protein (putative c-di-GMP-specific phosphodiesterase class I)
MQVIAEGVETQQQADWMLRHSCWHAQGYLFAKPMECSELLTWLGALEKRSA